jgi:RND superfamily putative drug exporter
MTAFLYRLGRACAHHRLPVLLAWLVIAVGLVAAAGTLGSQASDNVNLPGTGSQQVTDLLGRGFPDQQNGSSPIVLRAPQGRQVTDYQRAIDTSVTALQSNDLVAKVVSPLDRAGAGQVSRDGTVAFISVYPAESLGDITLDEAQGILDDANAAKDAGLRTSAGGPLGSKLSKPETESSEVVGLTIALIVLAFTFGTFVAMGLPILSALIGVTTGLAGITLLSHLTEVPTSAPTLAIMLGLGVGIDYALFIVTTHRDTLAHGMDVKESVARAVATSGGAVLFAGTTVVVAVCSLAVAGIPLVTTLGLTTGLMVAVAVVCALTLLPAILASVGRRPRASPTTTSRMASASAPTARSSWRSSSADRRSRTTPPSRSCSRRSREPTASRPSRRSRSTAPARSRRFPRSRERRRRTSQRRISSTSCATRRFRTRSEAPT